jgi:glycolate oxidase FAD binding subunit
MDLIAFADEVGATGPVTVSGLGTRGGAVVGARLVRAPAGIVEFQPDEMTVRCGAGTAMDELTAALAEAGQYTALPAGGTVGGALAAGRSDVLRLGRGPVRDALLQARYISAEGRVVKAGGPTVKNVSGFDLCRLLVGSLGTLGFLGEVILRTRPLPPVLCWYHSATADPFVLLGRIYKPASILWDGRSTWIALEGHPGDVEAQARLIPGAERVFGPPDLPTGGRRSIPPSAVRDLTGRFVAEVGVGVVHHGEAWTSRLVPSPPVIELHRRLKDLNDPTGRLNPGLDVLAMASGAE